MIGAAGLLGSEIVEKSNVVRDYLVVCDSCAEGLKRLTENPTVQNQNYTDVVLDASSEESVSRLVEEILELGATDIMLVNVCYPRNAAFGVSLSELDLQGFKDHVGLHLGSFFIVSKLFCELSEQLESISIVNFSSIYGTLAPRFQIYADTDMHMPIEYAAAKAGVIQISKYFAKYYLGRGVRVNCVSPGGISNGQNERFRSSYGHFTGGKDLMDKAMVVSTVDYLLNPDSCAVNGQNIIVDDGFSL